MEHTLDVEHRGGLSSGRAVDVVHAGDGVAKAPIHRKMGGADDGTGADDGDGMGMRGPRPGLRQISHRITPRGFAPRTPRHALSRAASPARSVRVARFAALA